MKSGQIFFGLIFLLVAACPALAQEVGKIMSIVGTAEVLRQERWQSVSLDETLLPGDIVRTGSGSRVAVLLADGSQLKVNANSQLLLKQVASPTRRVAMRLMQSLLRLFSGEIWVRSLGEPLEIETLAAVATIRGTELNLAVEPMEAARLTVVEGVVEFRNPQGSVLITAKEQAIAKPGEAPRKVVIINPRDAVQWALYYPPLIDYRQVIYPEGPDAQAIRRALEHYRRGALPETLRSLEQVPPERRDARFFTLRAGLLLSVSQVAEARADIEEALRRNPSEATAHALRSIIALVQNQKKEALRLARQAVELEPQSPVPYVARSYAEQSAFKIEEALASIKEASSLAPEDALVWARRAELELSLGDLDEALAAARKAQALDPKLARTQTVLGFAHLTRIDVDEARTAFDRAIALDPADPLPRLGLGLAKIREGDVDEGTKEIETAASLDPNNSLIRSYLGKAYFEQKRGVPVSTEFEQAKLLDPKDPTPWFYDAIHKQTTNRPVEALHDLQKAIELNDNRAVYRSRLLLDDDLAARSAALGRIYNDLGFQQLGLVEGWKSVNTDPSDYSAHRLLADNYAALPRHEIARVSELLQSQLLQPINITPVQPNLAESNLLILEASGPSDTSFNEFNPLFARNRLALQASGVVGSNDTYGDEVVQSGLWGKYSYSLGQFHFETDGFRENNDLKQDIYNVFLQGAITPQFNVQAEYRRRETKQGDLALNFDPENFSRDTRREFDQDTARLGARFSPSPQSDLIISGIYTDAEPSLDQFTGFPNPDVQARSDLEGYQVEAQYIFRYNQLNATAGGGTYDIASDTRTRLQFPIPCPLPTCDLQDKFHDEHYNTYLYTNLVLLTNLTWTIGLSYDAFDRRDREFEKVNPKVGVQWNFTDWARLRLAYFQAVKRVLVADQTIEPTQVAGFNQFFDDPNGTKTERYGAALDALLTDTLYGGLEYSRRDLEVPSFSLSQLRTESFDRWEDAYRAYLYWTPYRHWSVSAQAEFERFKRALTDPGVTQGGVPSKVETFTFPLATRYFHPRGFFATLGGTLVRQEVDLGPMSTFADDEDSFFILDATVGYRLPNRRGIISLEARNLLDEEFFFQDLNIQTARDDAVNPHFVPDRTIFIRATFAFN